MNQFKRESMIGFIVWTVITVICATIVIVYGLNTGDYKMWFLCLFPPLIALINLAGYVAG